jgi:prepilin-type N-terminal cleavage/methylation domain-containing protein/prepilin-type processing-associated H-X9-DG protein
MKTRRGLTLLEVVVVIAIIGILIAVLLPAIQYARETSRQVHCQSNLRQIMLGVQLYEGTHKTLPSGQSLSGSLFCAILPYIERGDVFDLIDTSKPAMTRFKIVDAIQIPLYVCPSDGAPLELVAGQDTLCGTNYCGNSGTWYPATGFDGVFRYNYGYPKGAGPPFSLGEMSRGTSNISAIAESLRGDHTRKRERVVWNYPLYFPPDQMDQFCTACSELPADPWSAGYVGSPDGRGRSWTNGSLTRTLYNHVVPPNRPSCVLVTTILEGVASSSSQHPGFVQVAYLDGHVERVSDQVNIAVWRASGKRGSD